MKGAAIYTCDFDWKHFVTFFAKNNSYGDICFYSAIKETKKQRKSTKNHKSVKMIFTCTNIVTYQNEVETV